MDGNNLDIARQVYTNAMTQYEKACTLSNSDQGDDLPGLLHNWGVGLQSAGTKLKVNFYIIPDKPNLLRYASLNLQVEQ